MKRVRALALAILTIAWALPVFGQQSIEYASIAGQVTDSSGGVIEGAEVTVRHLDTNVSGATVTDGEGRFRLPSLRIGPYEVVVRDEGFAEFRRQLTLGAGAAFDLPVSLSVAGIDAAVTVMAQAPVLEAARSQIAGTVPQAEIGSVPLNGRNFLELALLVPGVSPTNIASTQLFPETSAVPGVTLSVASQRNLSNSFVVDGLSANDDAAGLSGITYGVDAIEQFQVVTSGGQAELGRALGGYVNVVTRSGTNVRRGTVYGYIRDDGLNAKNALLDEKLPMGQAQYGASLGGPIVPDRTFYFANVEQRRLDQTGLATIQSANVDAINARLAAVGYGGPAIVTGVYPNPVDSTNFFAKVDHQVNPRDQFSVRYSLYDVSALNSRGAGGLNAPSASSALDSRDQTVAVSNTWVVSPRTVMETRGQFAYSDLQAPPTDPVGPSVSISGAASFGRLSSSPTGRINRMFQLVHSVSHHVGAHAIRIGGDYLYNHDRVIFPRAARGSYAFGSLQAFLSGTYNNLGFTQTFGATEVVQGNPNLGIYLQDEWRVSDGVTINLGVRYDLQFLETINTDRNNISPRLGVAWSPFESRRTVVRGSAGLFYDRVPLRPLANALMSAGNTTDLNNLRQIAVNLSPTQAGAPVFPAILGDAVPSGALPSLTTMDRNLQNAYSRQASVEAEHQLAERATVSVGYQYLRGVGLLMSINQNVPTCIASGTNNGCRPNPSYANNSQYSSAGSSSYHGLHVSFTQQPASWGQYRVSYTLSKAMSNLGEFFFSSPIDPFDVSKDWGRSDSDQRHRLVINGSVHTSTEPATTVWEHITRGLQVSGMLQAYSALPLNITSGVTTIQGTTGRPIVDGEFIPRNAGTGSDFFSLSARVSRVFRIAGRLDAEALAEGFNLTNRRNIVTRNATFGTGAYPTSPSATFGQVTAVGDPRVFQLGFRVRF
jgi:hypothetical protein